MSDMETGKRVVFTGPYLRHDNVHARPDGSFVVYAPLGDAFVLNTLGLAAIGAIEADLMPDHDQQVSRWAEANQGPNILSPEDPCA
ncbi:MAG TPA: hypothetical protein VM124_03950 [Candidatus Limnocylindrales bacterium]|nr:hypothetical protein [Candidatus Limnocylindrales bacterium]